MSGNNAQTLVEQAPNKSPSQVALPAEPSQLPDTPLTDTQLADPLQDDEQEIVLRVKWRSSTYIVELSQQETLVDLKNRLFEFTEVLPKRQKVLGLPTSSGRPPEDTLPIANLNLKPDHKIIMIGTREEDIDALNNAYTAVQHDVLNDLDFDVPDDHHKLRILYKNRLERRIDSTEFRIINPPRPGKRLLVLDLDYTLFDSKGIAATVADLGRPGLHAFLASVYPSYDIVVWSQTSWRWLEAKLTSLSMLFATDYKLSFVLDRTSMFRVRSRVANLTHRHEVKALEIIWRRFPAWNASNTIHIDDLSKNFALNPQSGLKIKPFRNAQTSRHSDRELFMLDLYLNLIAERESDFTTLDHKQWKKYVWSRNPTGYIHASRGNEGPPPDPSSS
ncbi:Ubiquitin-like domain-containing CTD phosphatase 1 [Gracilariopsis chorda]|uniref:protein-serine/threonine phosphatase n=1 Tax=Gracilariopsis chorda TaxID=448386 RepID=A0A2V3IWT3_9FLOR|nr:Ubiquitin-like domain-containing CTD phosphatase 1 [Gracilariopsis chorda]|eukprot:PXF46614.1 Ubiquitin-like domain-containing CTD phosphatase 1 [Gracilariopsis chorda]